MFSQYLLKGYSEIKPERSTDENTEYLHVSLLEYS